ncbi:MAG TPA: DnaB-like helicase C-terminal domain-containing protein [Acidimicrobiales bacterium]|nr:DnaB-like helicase C-terminal domain-containing protein [Acidimicrobiales bacterium]
MSVRLDSAPAAEAALLGAMLTTSQAVAVGLGLERDDFAEPRHRVIYDAVTAVAAEGKPVDVVTVSDQLAVTGQLEGVGGTAYLLALKADASVRHADAYAATVRSRARARAVAAALAGAQRALSDGEDPDAALAAVVTAAATAERSDIRPLAQALAQTVESAFDANGPGRIPTGLPELDRLLNGGIRRKQLVVVGARPAMGKTAFGLSLALHAAAAGERVLVVSAEVSCEDVCTRLIALRSGLPISALVGGGPLARGEIQAVERAVLELGELPIDVWDAAPRVGEVAARVRAEAIAGRAYGLVVLDYLQLLRTDWAQSRQEAVAGLSRAAKAELAMAQNVAVVALSQLSRAVESRTEKRPMLSDLRESGALEQDADVVVLLHRPEVYVPGVDPGVIELAVAKHRNGPTGTVRAAWLAERAAVFPLAYPAERL